MDTASEREVFIETAGSHIHQWDDERRLKKRLEPGKDSRVCMQVVHIYCTSPMIQRECMASVWT